jgi:hypothetical protein
MHTVNILTAIFDIPLATCHAVQFKKTVSSAIDDLRSRGQTNGLPLDLFYNRNNETGHSQNRYPLIQYTVVNGRAAIKAVNEGAETLLAVLDLLQKKENASCNKKFLLSKQNLVDLSHVEVHSSQHQIRLLTYKQQYLVRNWLPLDTHRYKAWMASQELKVLVELLDECLPRQLSAMLYGMDYQHNLPFLAHTTSILTTHEKQQIYHETKVPFDCLFSCNLSLPEGLGIGQVPGIGYGRVFNWNKSANNYHSESFLIQTSHE